MKNLGKLTKENDGYKVVLERTFSHSIEKVWDALTNPAVLGKWFTRIEGEFKPGGEIIIHFPDSRSSARIITMEKPNLFEFLWEDELASWQLREVAEGKTQLTLVYSRVAENYALSVSAGWHELINQLEEILGGRTEPYPFGGEPTEHGKALQQAYSQAVVQFYPELLQYDKQHSPVEVSKEYNASVERVWNAITNREQMKQWYFDLKEFRAEPGFEFTFYGGTEEKQWEHHCRIIEVVPLKKISYTWKYTGYEGISLVCWELTKSGEKTKVTLKHYGLHTFPASVPEFRKDNFVMGWTGFLETELHRFLEGKVQQA